MEHATALVDHDATTPTTCGCQRLADAGWAVRCFACGRGAEAVDVDVPLLTLVYRPGQHTCVLSGCQACMDELADDAEADEDDGYDELRDEVLVDAADRRVA